MSENKEGLHINGKVNSKSEYEGKNGTSYTLDIAVLGLRTLIPVRVTAEIFHKIENGQTFKNLISYSENKWGSSFALA